MLPVRTTKAVLPDDRRDFDVTAGTEPARAMELLAGGAPLPASGLQHFLVLLLAHPLAAFLYERAHVGPAG